jgi:hypothetical protein
VVGVLACYAAAAVWKWWLAPGWPSIVTKIVDFLDGRPASQIESLARRVIRLFSGLDLTRLRHRLIAGPDQLSAQEARYCLVASVGAHLPQVHGLSPRSRRLLFRTADRELQGTAEGREPSPSLRLRAR